MLYYNFWFINLLKEENKLKNYDTIIIGSGPAGIFSAYELITKNPTMKIAMIEKGKNIYQRHCPMSNENIHQCINCNACAIMRGFGGAGAFSDGKYNFTTKFGGHLSDYLSDKEVMNLIEYVDDINKNFINGEYYPEKPAPDYGWAHGDYHCTSSLNPKKCR
jgi:uncharacterized FAD-dependent dehydrogenase